MSQQRQFTEAELSSDPDNIPPRSRLFIVVPKQADSQKIHVRGRWGHGMKASMRFRVAEGAGYTGWERGMHGRVPDPGRNWACPRHSRPQEDIAVFEDLEYCKTDLIASKGVVFCKFKKSSSALRALEAISERGTVRLRFQRRCHCSAGPAGCATRSGTHLGERFPLIAGGRQQSQGHAGRAQDQAWQAGCFAPRHDVPPHAAGSHRQGPWVPVQRCLEGRQGPWVRLRAVKALCLHMFDQSLTSLRLPCTFVQAPKMDYMEQLKLMQGQILGGEGKCSME